MKKNSDMMLRKLANKEGRKNRAINVIMMFTFTASVLIMFLIMTMLGGRLDAETLMGVRHNGNTAAAYIENPTNKQLRRLRKLKYIKEMGVINRFAEGGKSGAGKLACVAADKNTFYNIFAPAYSGIQGHYPVEKNEVMLPLRGLKYLGIEKPKLNMTLHFDVHVDKDNSRSGTFRLCGFYKEYVNPAEGQPIVFFSKAGMQPFSITDTSPTKVMIEPVNIFSGKSIEKLLGNDIKMTGDTQMRKSDDSVRYSVVKHLLGGYDIVILAAIAILFSVFFINYNIMNMSLQKNIKYYGLLKTLGVTNKQLRHMKRYQFFALGGIGTVCSTIFSIAAIQIILPKLLGSYYLYQYGVSSKMITFHLPMFLICLLIAWLLLHLSIFIPLRKVYHAEPIEAMKGIGEENKQGRILTLTRNKNVSGRLAAGNVLRNAKKVSVSLISLFLGITMALCAVVITKGTDITNNFEQQPDFSFRTLYAPGADKNYDKNFSVISKKDIEYFNSLDGVRKTTCIYGDFIRLDPKTEALSPFIEANKLDVTSLTKKDDIEDANYRLKNFYSALVIADDAFISQLESYAKKRNIKLDLEELKNGNSVICTDGSMLSPDMKKHSETYIGAPLVLCDSDGKKIGSLSFGGYLDDGDENCPKRHFMISSNGPEFLIGEKAFEKLGLPKKAYITNLDVVPEKEAQIKSDIKRFMEERKNRITPGEEDKLPLLSINSEGLAAAKDQIQTTRILMTAISFLLIFLGIFNYLSMEMSNFLSRRKEFALLETIGLTRKQLQKMLIDEGLILAVLLIVAVCSAGSGIVLLVFYLLNERLRYARLFFPYVLILVLSLLIVLMCVGIPLILYRRTEKESVIERLRRSE